MGVDIGGGSTELMISSNKILEYVTSIRVSPILLGNRFLKVEKSNSKNLSDLKNEIKSCLAPLRSNLIQKEFETGVLCSGIAKVLVSIDSKEKKKTIQDPNGYILKSDSLVKMKKALEKIQDPVKISSKFGIAGNRGLTIIPSLIILDNLSKMFKIKYWLASTYGLREGLVIDSLAKLNYRNESLPFLDDVREKKCISLG